MGFKVDPTSPIYKRFRLKVLGEFPRPLRLDNRTNLLLHKRYPIPCHQPVEPRNAMHFPHLEYRKSRLNKHGCRSYLVN